MTTSPALSRRGMLAASAAASLFLTARPSAASIGGVTFVRDAAALAGNPVYAPWPGPNGGVPPWDKVKVEHLKPALVQAMKDQLANIDRITANRAAPTFDNTVAAYEASGRALERAGTIYGVLSSSLSTPEFRAAQPELEALFAAHANAINQNAALYARIKAVEATRETSNLTPEQQRVVWLHRTDFIRGGAELSPAARIRVGEISQELSQKFTAFRRNLLADEETWIVVDDRAALRGLPDAFIDALAMAAEERGLKGRWAVVNTRSSVDPVLTYADDRDLRRRVWTAFIMRGDNGDANDNKALIADILKLRHERAGLLGHPTHAHMRLHNTMAQTPQRAMTLLEQVWRPAVARVHEEVRDMQTLADGQGGGIKIAPWDYRYYQEKVRKARYDLDEGEVKAYLQLDQLRDAMFWAVGRNFGWTVVAADLPVYHPDVTAWQVKDAQGRHIGYFYFDPFARSGKRSGAWMNQIRSQERFAGAVTPVVSNNENFVKPAPGRPALISWDDATTLFHEFGHGMHGLASDVVYPSVSGTNVPGDFLEFPSQMWELWLSDRQILGRFALHHETGRPMPTELMDKVERARHFNQGFATVEFLASAIVDMRYHLAETPPSDPAAFEKAVLAEIGLPDELVMRHRSPQFGHIFASDSYSAGYYAYLWADTLVADAGERFATAPGGFFDPELSRRYYDIALKVGNSRDPAETYRMLMGRDADPAALLRKRGFA
ncbi:MAG TPA: peptidase M3 [Brevundimonas sp.]|nr:peptidase M3 [Brevundimonas sp.]